MPRRTIPNGTCYLRTTFFFNNGLYLRVRLQPRLTLIIRLRLKVSPYLHLNAYIYLRLRAILYLYFRLTRRIYLRASRHFCLKTILLTSLWPPVISFGRTNQKFLELWLRPQGCIKTSNLDGSFGQIKALYVHVTKMLNQLRGENIDKYFYRRRRTLPIFLNLIWNLYAT